MAAIDTMKRGLGHIAAAGGLHLEEVEGIPLPVARKGVEDLRSRFSLRPSDVFTIAYPKTGATWLRLIVRLISTNGVEDGSYTDLNQAVPVLEVLTPEEAEAMSKSFPRCFRTHFPYHLLPGGEPASTSAKYIYVYRNPKDTAVSSYHYALGFQFSPSTSWDDFFEHFIKGEMPYGSILDHIQEWWKHRAAKNILIVNYESMKKDLPQVIKTIADFLGYNLTPETISKIAELTTFETMKRNPATNEEYQHEHRREKSTPFMRKGVVGDWRNVFSEEQSARMDEECAKRFSGSGLVFDYGP